MQENRIQGMTRYFKTSLSSLSFKALNFRHLKTPEVNDFNVLGGAGYLARQFLRIAS